MADTRLHWRNWGHRTRGKVGALVEAASSTRDILAQFSSGEVWDEQLASLTAALAAIEGLIVMRHEIRVTIEMLDGDTVREPLDTKEVLLGIEDGALDGGAMGDLEQAIDELVEEYS